MARVTLLALIAVVGVAVLTAEFAGGERMRLGLGADAPADAAPAPGGTERLFSLDGTSPDAAPESRLAVGFLQLDDPLDRAVDVLGFPASVEPDINETLTHTWRLPGEAVLSVTATDRPPERIAGLYVRVPPGSPVRMPTYGGVTPGKSTLAETIEAWGQGYATGMRGDDFAVRYVQCAGAFPVVVKFDVDPAAASRAQVTGEETVVSVLLAYADADPGTEGCPAV